MGEVFRELIIPWIGGLSFLIGSLGIVITLIGIVLYFMFKIKSDCLLDIMDSALAVSIISYDLMFASLIIGLLI